MIVLFTSNEKGGILQFTIKLLNTLIKMNYEAKAFIPQGSIVTINDTIKDKVVFYRKKKTINIYNKELKSICDRIRQLRPDLLWLCDATIQSTEISSLIGEKIKQILTIHDGGIVHSSYAKGVRKTIRRYIEKTMEKKSLKVVHKVMLLSEETKNIFISCYPMYKSKIIVLNLGAHVPEVDGQKPIEQLPDKYFLFFGRIDKYKGIICLLNAYKLYSGDVGLVIAGNGEMTVEEKQALKEETRCIYINRYIKDEEMVWLFENAYALVLPYLEATQSGIIPISYTFGKPVIVSNVKGLTQFVENEITGFICKEEKDYVNAFRLVESDPTLFSEKCKEYYDKHLEWEKNIHKLFQQLKINKKQ